MGLSPLILVAILLDHTFQSTNLETFHVKENGWGVLCEKELNFVGTTILWELSRL